MVVDTCASFAYKRALDLISIKDLKRGPVKFGAPSQLRRSCQQSRLPSGSSSVNVIVDAGSSSVRIQRVTGGEMLRAMIESHLVRPLCLARGTRPQELSLTIA